MKSGMRRAGRDKARVRPLIPAFLPSLWLDEACVRSAVAQSSISRQHRVHPLDKRVELVHVVPPGTPPSTDFVTTPSSLISPDVNWMYASGAFI